ncbi:hypothetical protein PENTCL1PPCAC_19559, partial [Pristionchus entomophagus]
AAAAVAAGPVVVPPKSASQQLPLKTKATAKPAVAAAVVAARPGGGPVTPADPKIAALAAAAESRLFYVVLSVCREEKRVEEAMGLIETREMSTETIAKCLCRTLVQLPQANLWPQLRAAIRRKGVKTTELDEMVPTAEKRLLEMLVTMRKSEQRLKGLLHCFYDEYFRFVHSQMDKSTTTDEVTRMMRILFYGLWCIQQIDEDEEEKKNRLDEAKKMFILVLQNKSSQAVCQSLTSLLCQSRTAPFASEILMTSLNDEENGGWFISMHMNDKNKEVLYWAIYKFAEQRCKALRNAAYMTSATKDMVETWWNSELGFYVASVRNKPDSVSFSRIRHIELDEPSNKLVARMSVLISPQFQIEGLNRVKLLSQLDASAIEVIGRATAAGNALPSTSSSSISPPSSFIDEGDARIIVLKLQIAMAALNHLYADPMNDVEQRDYLQPHLTRLLKKVSAIRERDNEANEDESEGYGLPFAMLAMYKWREMVWSLIGGEEDNSSSDESGPAKKRPRE